MTQPIFNIVEYEISDTEFEFMVYDDETQHSKFTLYDLCNGSYSLIAHHYLNEKNPNININLTGILTFENYIEKIRNLLNSLYSN